MNKLLDIDNNFITNLITLAYPTYDGTKIRNRLLDGSYHIQSVGEQTKIMNIACDVTEQGKCTLDEAYNIDKPIRLEWYGKFYIGLIEEYPELDVLVKGDNNKRRYTAQFRIMVSKEGTA